MKKSSITTRDPLCEVGQIQNRLANVLSSRAGGAILGFSDTAWAPALAIKEDDQAFTITADFSDVKKEHVKVVVEDGVLSFSGSRRTKAEEKDEKKKFHGVERSSGSYLRKFQLPEGIDEEKVSANYHDGVLAISLPRVPAEEPRQVAVSVE